MKASKSLFAAIFIFLFNLANGQSVFYSVNGASNPNLLNSWTKDNTGNTLLLPPADFNNLEDIFIIDGETMNLTSNWFVAGEIRVEKGSIFNYNYYKFKTKKLVINNDKSGMHINDDDDVRIGTLQIGPNGWFSTANIGLGLASQIDDSLVVYGKLSVLSPVIGTGKFILKDGATLETTNGEISKTGSAGNIRLTGSRFYSKLAKYHYISSVGNFITGDALPDTVAELFIDYYQSSTTITSSTTVTGTFSSSGAWGSSSNNNSISLGSSKIKCLGNISIAGNVAISGNKNSALILSGTNTSSISLPAITVDSFVFDRSATLTLNGNLTAISGLNLIKGKIQTNSYLVQIGTSMEGRTYYSQGWIVGTLAILKDKTHKDPMTFPVGNNNYSAPVCITYNAPPLTDGLIKVSFIEGTGTSSLNPEITDGAISLNYRSNFYWKVEPVLVSGGTFNVQLDAKDILGITKSLSSTLLVSDASGSQFYLKGDRSSGTETFIKRNNLTGTNTFGRFYIGGTTQPFSILSVSKDILNISSGFSSNSLEIVSNLDWTITCDKSWLTTDIANGSNSSAIKINAEANPTTSERMANMIVSAPGVPNQTITITQQGAAPVLTTSSISLALQAANNSTATFDISSNTSWNISDDQNWLSTNVTNGSYNASITITAIANPMAPKRTGHITVSGVGFAEKIISVTQEGASPVFSLSTDVLTIGALANSSKTFTITSNTYWNVTSNQSWLKIITENGSNNSEVTIKAEANPFIKERTATITVKGVNVDDKTITVTQEKGEPLLTVINNALTFSATGGDNLTLDIISNIKWTATLDQNWLTLNSYSGENNKTLTISLSKNESTKSRKANLTLSGSGVTNQVISITQEGVSPVLTVGNNTLTITAAANNAQTISVNSNIDWTAISDQSWLTLNNTSGSNNATLSLSASENTNTSARSATITISGPGVTSILISVTQGGRPTQIIDETEAELYIYPNPASEWLIINGPSEGQLVCISDLNGKILKKIKLNGNKINISNLPKGAYIVTLNKRNTILKTKLFKN